jgi:hypothetical protein
MKAPYKLTPRLPKLFPSITALPLKKKTAANRLPTIEHQMQNRKLALCQNLEMQSLKKTLALVCSMHTRPTMIGVGAQNFLSLMHAFIRVGIIIE